MGGMMARDLCDSAKRGKVCIDSLCKSNPDNTLCGFDQSEYDEMTAEYFTAEAHEQPFDDD